MTQLFSNVFKLATRTIQTSLVPSFKITAHFSQLAQVPSTLLTSPLSSAWSVTQIRTKIRENFPRPSETKRVKVLGWKARLSTKGGKRIIMRRMLKGRYVLTH